MTGTAAIAAAGAAAGAIAVALGAFGAHALHGVLDADALRTWHTAVEYQFWHALALLALVRAPASRWRGAAAAAFCLGMLLFCASLYALALGAPRAIGAATPVGGALLIAGWICLGTCFSRPSA